MIPNCEGCDYEWKEACYQVANEELHLATTIDNEMSYPFGRHHFCMILVDDNGRVVVG